MHAANVVFKSYFINNNCQVMELFTLYRPFCLVYVVNFIPMD